MLVPSKESAPKHNKRSDCGTFICNFGYFISQDASLEFTQAHVTSFQKGMALAIKKFVNNTEVKAESVEDLSLSSKDVQEIEPV